MLGFELKHADDHIRDLGMLGFQRFVALIEAELVKLGKPQAKMLAAGMSSILVGAVTLASITPHKATAKKVLKDARECSATSTDRPVPMLHPFDVTIMLQNGHHVDHAKRTSWEGARKVPENASVGFVRRKWGNYMFGAEGIDLNACIIAELPATGS